jgi:hypothetical protein
MSRSIVDTLRHLNGGVFLDDASDALAEVVKAVDATGKAGSALSFWYELVRPDRVFKTAVATEIDKIKEAAGFTVLFGRPDAKDRF